MYGGEGYKSSLSILLPMLHKVQKYSPPTPHYRPPSNSSNRMSEAEFDFLKRFSGFALKMKPVSWSFSWPTLVANILDISSKNGRTTTNNEEYMASKIHDHIVQF